MGTHRGDGLVRAQNSGDKILGPRAGRHQYRAGLYVQIGAAEAVRGSSAAHGAIADPEPVDPSVVDRDGPVLSGGPDKVEREPLRVRHLRIVPEGATGQPGRVEIREEAQTLIP